jgi:hypothetical protein
MRNQDQELSYEKRSAELRAFYERSKNNPQLCAIADKAYEDYKKQNQYGKRQLVTLDQFIKNRLKSMEEYNKDLCDERHENIRVNVIKIKDNKKSIFIVRLRVHLGFRGK